MGITREILLRGSQNKWLADQLTRRSFTKQAVERFMPGEEMHSAVDAAASLGEKGMASILTLLGENINEATEANGVVQEYLNILDRVTELKLDAYLSLKPTQFGLDFGFEQTLNNMEKVLHHAAELNNFVAVDMESSAYADRTIELYRHLRKDHENVALCLQAYLFRTAADLELLLDVSPKIRLVKGAYKEAKNLAYVRKKDVDESFVRLTTRLFEAMKEDERVQVVFGTHDTRLIERISQLAKELGIDRDAFEIQMLYGIQRDMQSQLVEHGYRVRVLISYGPSWFPWYMRRLAERPANMMFLLRNLFS